MGRNLESRKKLTLARLMNSTALNEKIIVNSFGIFNYMYKALSLVEKAEPVQICFTLRLRDQRSMWMQDGCEVYMDSYMASNGSCFMVAWTIFQKPPLGGRPNTKPGDHGTSNAHNRWFILFCHVRGPAWINIYGNNLWLRARSHMTSHYTWGSMTILHDLGGVLERPLDTFFWALTIPWS